MATPGSVSLGGAAHAPARRWRNARPLLLGLVSTAALGYLFWALYWTHRLFRAPFLPGNLQLTLHLASAALLSVLGAWLLGRCWRQRHVWALELPDGQEHELRGRIVLGSDRASSDLYVGSPVVSRRHAELSPAPDGVVIRDLGSTNGTFAGGLDLRWRGPLTLAAGDPFVLGENGPVWTVVRVPAKGLLAGIAWPLLLACLLAAGLATGFCGNLQRLPERPVVVGTTAIGFEVFRAVVPAVVVGVAFAALIAGAVAVRRRPGRGRGAIEGAAAAALLLAVAGSVTLYSLLPAVGLRYARAAERAWESVGAANWAQIESWEKAGGRPGELRKSLLAGDAAGIPAELRGLGQPPNELASALARYAEGRAALRWAANLAGRAGEPFYSRTYFVQTLTLVAALFAALVLPGLWPPLARAARGGLARLARPLSPRLVRAADAGSPWARRFRFALYPDLLLGFAAAGLVAATLWSPLGSTLGRGKSLYLDLPGMPPMQAVELVKGLFVLFLAGYFARHGELMARTARPRYFAPFLAAALGVLALTAVQADLGGLFMLALFLGIVFVVATGQLRLALAVPLLLVPGLALAWKLGHASIVATRFGLWLDPRGAPLGEQIVEARQLLLSSGWFGHVPGRALAAEIPDVHGDLVIAALAERFGFVGVAMLLAAGFVFVVSLLRAARSAERPAALLLVGLAALFLVQVLAQVGGVTGLLPLTGVPLPWLSHGLTATLVFTLLLGVAVAAGAPIARSASPESEREPVSHLARHLRGFGWFAAALTAALVAAVAWWTVVLPARGALGPRGADYRWRDSRLESEIARLVGAEVFRPAEREARVRIDGAAVARLRREGGLALAPDELGRLADGMRVTERGLAPLPWLVSRGNRFAERGLPRGRVLTADGVAVALTDSRGRRLYPRGGEMFHPLGYAGGLTQGSGVESSAGDLLRGVDLAPPLRLRAFVEDVHYGPDLVLTIDSAVQARAYELLAGRRGATVAIDLASGGLLALASAPSVAPAGARAADWRAWASSPAQPLRNRAIERAQDYSPPGSVFKIAMAAAILDGGSGIDPNERIRCAGHDPELGVSCAHGKAHGAVDLERALAVSCNVYFAHAAVALGEERIRDAAKRLGFNAEAPLDLLHEVPGAALVASRSTVLVDAAGRSIALRPKDLARVGYGQGPVDATLLDVARMGATIAAGGRRIEPRLGRVLELSRAGTDGVAETVWRDELASAGAARQLPSLVAVQVESLLRGVFEHPEGTARRLPKLWTSEGRYRLASSSPGDDWERVPMAGKTGSAWRSRRDATDDAWMVVWAPVEGARVVVATLLEDAGEGGKVAGPVALEVLRTALERMHAAR